MTQQIVRQKTEILAEYDSAKTRRVKDRLALEVSIDTRNATRQLISETQALLAEYRTFNKKIDEILSEPLATEFTTTSAD